MPTRVGGKYFNFAATFLAGLSPLINVDHVAASINLEFRPVNPVVSVGDPVQMQLFAVSDNQTNQLLSAIQLIFTWEPLHLTLTGNSTAGAPPLAFSGFPTSGDYGLNESLIPQDGDGFFLALSFSPVAATPGGTLITTFNFTAISPTDSPARIGMLLTGGDGGQTIIASGSVPGLNVTGTLTDGFVTIVPEPGTLAVICGVFGAVAARRSRRPRCTHETPKRICGHES